MSDQPSGMDQYRKEIEDTILYRLEIYRQATGRGYQMPSSAEGDQDLKRRIYDAYYQVINETDGIPSVVQLYREIWVSDYSVMFHIAEEVVDEYLQKLEQHQKIKFYDEESKDFLSEICSTINTFLEARGYRYDLTSYIKDFVVGTLGFAVFVTNPSTDAVNIIAGDAHTFLPISFGSLYEPIGQNLLSEPYFKGGYVLVTNR